MGVPGQSHKAQCLKLVDAKDKIERKITEYGEILKVNNVGMTDSLVDDQGFPRNDIDVYQVRHARHEIICLQNDLKKLMNEIHKSLELVHQEAASDNSVGTSKMSISQSNDTIEEVLDVFLIINMVSPGSPAEDAGLKEGDQIVEFGSINCKNFQNITSIGELVKRREKQKVLVKVKRDVRILEFNLIPNKWSGRGLLGCNIVLPEAIER